MLIRRTTHFLLAFCLLTSSASAQSWSSFLDPSRAIDWTQGVGFSIPNYSVNCSSQPSLVSGSGNAAANATSITTALTSCDGTHNVVNVPAGTYYIAALTFPAHGAQVLRGAGPNSTTLISTAQAGCNGQNAGICMTSTSWTYSGAANVQPPSGTNQCLWTGGFTQGSTTLTFTSCGGAPPVNKMIILDQSNDSTDNGGIYVCDERTPVSCNYDGTGGSVGRVISGVGHSQMQVTYATGVTSLGGGSYTVTISPGVYFNNIRSGQTPGAWWSDITTNNGVENMTIDGTSDAYATLVMFDCYQCWVKNVTMLYGARASVMMYQSLQDVIRDSYFYQAQSHTQVSYNIDPETSSGFLVENNIFQQVTLPILVNAGSGAVIGYNYAVKDTAFAGYTWPAFVSHNAGNSLILWEGNNFPGLEADDAWGPPSDQTFFRNLLRGWESGGTNGSLPIILRSYARGFNVAGNVMGQPSYHNQYQTYATSTSAGTGAGSENTSIYTLGWALTGPVCGTGTATSSPYCDSAVFSTLMRWGNWDVVTNGTKWDSTEASPGAVSYLNANFTSTYFNSLAHTLPSSLYYNSQPSWWPTTKAWPPVGPDVSSGNLGTCSGTYAGAQGTASSQCSGGTLTSQYGGHAYSLPAQDCYLNVMGGPPDGTGSVLSFNNNSCQQAVPVYGFFSIHSPGQ